MWKEITVVKNWGISELLASCKQSTKRWGGECPSWRHIGGSHVPIVSCSPMPTHSNSFGNGWLYQISQRKLLSETLELFRRMEEGRLLLLLHKSTKNTWEFWTWDGMEHGVPFIWVIRKWALNTIVLSHPCKEGGHVANWLHQGALDAFSQVSKLAKSFQSIHLFVFSLHPFPLSLHWVFK
jgi:hypothetical protein